MGLFDLFSQETPPAVAPTGQTIKSPFQTFLEQQGVQMPSIDPAQEQRKAIARALFTMSSSLGSNTQDFIPSMTAALAQGGNAYLDQRDKTDTARQERAKTLLSGALSFDGRSGRGGTNKYSTDLTYIQGADGKVHAYQTFQGGGLGPEVTTGPGSQVLTPNQFVNTGTSINPTNKLTGLPSAPPIPVQNEQVAADKQKGKLEGQKQFDLPRIEQNAGTMFQTLDQSRGGREGRPRYGWGGCWRSPTVVGRGECSMGRRPRRRDKVQLLLQPNPRAAVPPSLRDPEGRGADHRDRGAKGTQTP
jgi:hypothetical protein